MPDDVKRLQKLLIEEVSGVEDPANEAPGWIVLKRRGQAIRERLRKRANDEPIFGLFAVVDRVTGKVTMFTGTPGTARDDFYAAMAVAGFDPDTIRAVGGTPDAVKRGLRKAAPEEYPAPIPDERGGTQPTGAPSRQGHPRRQQRDDRGRWRRSLIQRHGGASLFR